MSVEQHRDSAYNHLQQSLHAIHAPYTWIMMDECWHMLHLTLFIVIASQAASIVHPLMSLMALSPGGGKSIMNKRRPAILRGDTFWLVLGACSYKHELQNLKTTRLMVNQATCWGWLSASTATSASLEISVQLAHIYIASVQWSALYFAFAWCSGSTRSSCLEDLINAEARMPKQIWKRRGFANLDTDYYCNNSWLHTFAAPSIYLQDWSTLLGQILEDAGMCCWKQKGAASRLIATWHSGELSICILERLIRRNDSRLRTLCKMAFLVGCRMYGTCILHYSIFRFITVHPNKLMDWPHRSQTCAEPFNIFNQDYFKCWPTRTYWCSARICWQARTL